MVDKSTYRSDLLLLANRGQKQSPHISYIGLHTEAPTAHNILPKIRLENIRTKKGKKRKGERGKFHMEIEDTNKRVERITYMSLSYRVLINPHHQHHHQLNRTKTLRHKVQVTVSKKERSRQQPVRNLSNR